MRNKIFTYGCILMLSMGLMGCPPENQPSVSPITSKTNWLVREIGYHKDYNTGLCFAFIDAYHISVTGGRDGFYTSTCVPCDSLKNLEKIGEP